MTDLEKLIAAVEAGDLAATNFRCLPRGTWLDAADAQHGSLDAAHRLHDVLLPGWDYLVSRHDAEIWQTGYYPNTTKEQVMGNPARAWLLAVLRALAADKQPPAGEGG